MILKFLRKRIKEHKYEYGMYKNELTSITNSKKTITLLSPFTGQQKQQYTYLEWIVPNKSFARVVCSFYLFVGFLSFLFYSYFSGFVTLKHEGHFLRLH